MQKIIVITGATDGIGLVAAQKFLSLGHTVLAHGRNESKLASIKGQLIDKTGSQAIDTCCADLSDLNAVDGMIQRIQAQYPRLDVLVNNAGVLKTPQPILADGFDIRFVVNALVPYRLTKALLPNLGQTGRVINLSSAAQASVDILALTGKAQLTDDFAAYSQSKLALTLWTLAMAQQQTDNGPMMLALNPGSLLASKMVQEGFGVPGKDINIGADIIVKTALDPQFAGATGRYFDNDIGSLSAPHGDALDTDIVARVMAAIDQTRYAV